MISALKNTYVVLAVTYAVTIFASFAVFLVPSTPAGAASQGCYTRTLAGERITISPTECPPAQQRLFDLNSPANANDCFFITNGSESENVKCDTFTVGQTNIGTDGEAAQIGGGSNPTGINDPNLVAGGEFETSEDDCSGTELNKSNCAIIGYLVVLINVLSGLAGIVIVGSIMIAGYTYMTARDNAGQIMKAKMRIVWTLAALALFIFMYGLLNFLVPGGVL